MAFSKSLLNITRGTLNNYVREGQLTTHTYRSLTDTLGQISSAGYFPDYLSASQDEVNINDLIIINGSDGFGSYKITSLSPLLLSAEDVSDNAEFNSIKVNSITEKTVDNGVNIEDVLIKDNNITSSNIDTDTLTANTINVDNVLEKTLSNGVYVQGSVFTRPGATQTKVQIGKSTGDNTQDAVLHLQGKSDVKMFLESDTDGTTPNDNPRIYYSVDANASTLMTNISPDGSAINIVGGHDGTNMTPSVYFRLGQTYTNPGTGVIPNLSSTATVHASISTTALKVGNTTDNTNKTLHVQSKQDSVLFLESDTDNVTETDNPIIIGTQDGGNVGFQIGNSDNTLNLDLLDAPGTNNVNFSINSTAMTNNGAGNLPTIGTRTPIVDFNRGTRIADFKVGATFPTSGGTKATLNFFESRSSVSGVWTGATGAWGGISITLYFSRIGNIVQVEAASDYSAALTNADTFLLSPAGFVPTRFRPTTTIHVPLIVLDNSVEINGYAIFYPSGNIEIYKTNKVAFTGGGVSAGFINFSGTYSS